MPKNPPKDGIFLQKVPKHTNFDRPRGSRALSCPYLRTLMMPTLGQISVLKVTKFRPNILFRLVNLTSASITTATTTKYHQDPLNGNVSLEHSSDLFSIIKVHLQAYCLNSRLLIIQKTNAIKYFVLKKS